MMLILVSLFLGTIYTLLLLWSRNAWVHAGNVRREESDGELPLITVIIPARNEENNIQACLQSIINQRYPREKYEIIVVDDHSTDNTCEIVNAIRNPHVRLIRLQEVLKDMKTRAYKKMAIAAAINVAKGELIVTTDADCVAGKEWLSAISACYHTSRADLIVMPVRIKSGNNPLSVFETLDFLSLQGMTGALVSRGKISMANGANLCYTKELFTRLNGFEGIDHIASGDDMLLAEKARSAGAVIHYLKDPAVIVDTNPSPGLKSFFRQRIRWASKSSGYKDARIKWVLGLVYLLNLSMVLLLIKSMQGCNCEAEIFGGIGPASAFCILLGGKIFFETIFLWPVAGFFKQKRLLWYFPLAQLPHMLYVVSSGFLGLFGSYEWKGRRVK